MIKKLMWKLYRKDRKSDAEFESFYYFHHFYFGLEFFLDLRIFLYLIIATIVWFSSLVSLLQSNQTTSMQWIISIPVGIILAVLFGVLLKNKIEKFFSKIYPANTKKLCDFFHKLFTLYNNKVVSAKNWKKIKLSDKELYSALTSDRSLHCCQDVALILALILKDVDLIWCSVDCPVGHERYAHAFIVKDGYVYDSNFRLCYKFEDYSKFDNLRIYKTWSYPEYSIPNFRASVREDFRRWCQENDVTHYKNF